MRASFSILCAIACVLLVTLWNRSYFYCDGLFLKLPNAQCLELDSMYGDIAFAIFPSSKMPPNRTWWLGYGEAKPGLHFAPESTIIPIWLPILIAATIGAAPWLRYRFCLRTLLVATAVVALALAFLTIARR